MDESVRDGQQGREDLLAKLSIEDKISLLTGFATGEAPPGTQVFADIVVQARRLAHWDNATAIRAIEPRDFHLHIGRSSGDVLLSVTVRC